MSDDEERHTSSLHDVDHLHRRRLSEIKLELQGWMRQKKKYDVEKLNQNADFLQGEINDLGIAISDMHRVINNQTSTKKKLHIAMTNLRSRSQLRFGNLNIALREKRRCEWELKKEDKNEEYRELARKQIRAIDAALPILKEEDEYKAQIKKAEDDQQAAVTRRKKLQENLERDLQKLAETKRLLGENSEQLPIIEEKIKHLLAERERLMPSTEHGKRQRQRHHCLTNRDPPPPPPPPLPISSRSVGSLEEDSFEQEKQQCLEQLTQVNTLVSYFQDKMNEHGLQASSDLPSPNPLPGLSLDDQQSILSSFMHEQESPDILLHQQPTTSNEPVAMKLPRHFLPLDLKNSPTLEIIHSPYRDGNEIEYKKELSSDILNKYGGQTKKSKASPSAANHRSQRKQRKHFAISHRPQMIALYTTVRSSCESSDTLPSMPMYEYDLLPTIKALESFKQSLEFYLIELNARQESRSLIGEEQFNRPAGLENEDSALDTVSEASSLIDSSNITGRLTPTISPLLNILELASLSSSEDKKTITSSSSDHSHSKDLIHSIPEHPLIYSFKPMLSETLPIDRQISDEGYRSVRNEQQRQGTSSIPRSSPLFTRSKSDDCTDKVDRWLSSAVSSLASSVPVSMSYSLANQDDFQPTEIEHDGD